MEPIYDKRGGGHIGYCWPLCWQGSWPIARLQIYADKAILSVWPFKSVIKIKDIDYITNQFWRGIRINHHGHNARYLVFFLLNTDEAVNAFKKVGVKLK